MTGDEEIDVFVVLDWIRNNAPAYAQAKAERVYLEEFRRSKRALLMRDAELADHKSSAAQEREAYANPEYMDLLKALRTAVENEERFRWLFVAAQAKVEVWRSLSANKRAEAKIL